jgi:hypothetical protein
VGSFSWEANSQSSIQLSFLSQTRSVLRAEKTTYITSVRASQLGVIRPKLPMCHGLGLIFVAFLSLGLCSLLLRLFPRCIVG